MTTKKFILIDYENVHPFSSVDLTVVKSDGFIAKLFLGVHNKEISVELFFLKRGEYTCRGRRDG